MEQLFKMKKKKRKYIKFLEYITEQNRNDEQTWRTVHKRIVANQFLSKKSSSALLVQGQ